MAPLVPLVSDPAGHVEGRFLALCDHCRRPTPIEIDAPTLEAARARLVDRGWVERDARRADGRVRRAWQCPACASRVELTPC